MGDIEPEQGIFYYQSMLPAMGQGHQTSHKTFNLQSVLPERCAGVLEGQNSWEWPINVCSNLSTTLIVT